ncbi:four helix bundle protein, partial [Candidatus Fermentibacterales bacterium]|nr:four helix bundle protein [Candidatus Fermentibacterales bacterium]
APSPEELASAPSTRGEALSAMHVWQEAMDLVVHCARLVREFPGTEKYDLCYKMRLCAHEVSSGIARAMRFDDSLCFVYHLNSAYSRLLWLETDLELAESLGYVEDDEADLFRKHMGLLQRMIRKLIDTTREANSESGVLVESCG